MNTTRRKAIKAIRNEFGFDAVNYSEERSETYRVKWYNMKPWVMTPAKIAEVKSFVAKNFPSVKVSMVAAISGKGTATKSLVMNFPKREFA